MDPQSPRTRVALAMMGIDFEKDLEERSMNDFPGSLEARQQELAIYDTRRARLIEKVEYLRIEEVTDEMLAEQALMERHAARLPSSTAQGRSPSPPHSPRTEVPLSPTVRALLEAQEKANQSVLQRERDHLTTLRKNIQGDIVKSIQDEMRKQEMEKLREEHNKKFAEKKEQQRILREERQAKLIQEIREKQEKKRQLMAESERLKFQLKIEMEQKMKQKMEAVAEKRKLIFALKAEEAAEYQSKTAEIKTRIAETRKTQHSEALEKFNLLENKCEKIQINKNLISQDLTLKAKMRSEIFAKHVVAGKTLKEEVMKHKEAVFETITDHVHAARARSAKSREDSLRAIAERNKRLDDQAKLMRETVKQKEQERHQKVIDDFHSKEGKRDCLAQKQQIYDNLVKSIQDKRIVHQFVTKLNRERVERAKSFDNDRRMLKLILQTDKMKMLKTEQKKIQEQRLVCLVKSADEKNQLMRKFDKLKYAANNANMFDRLVAEMGIQLTPEPTTELE